MTLRALSNAAAAAALALVAGCADTRSGYPSLAPRPVERALLHAEPAPAAPAAVAQAAPAATAGLAQLLTGAQTADAAFRAALEKARPTIEAGRAAAEGSEAWVAGQQAYSAAETERLPVSQALAEIDRRLEAAVEAGQAGAEPALGEAMLQLQALDEAERALLDAVLPS